MPQLKYAHILNAVFGSIWAIQEEKAAEMVAFLRFAAGGGKYTEAEVSEKLGLQAAALGSPTPQGGIAVISIRGIIAQHAEAIDDISGPGGTSTVRVARQLRAALADDSVKGILFHVNSPGGSSYGVDELSTEIYKSRGKKPMVACFDSLSASAAYWIATAADECVMTPGGDCGSVGVFMMHTEFSKWLEEAGIKITYISAGDYKTEGNDTEPLTDEARAAFKERVDECYGAFVKAVARNRGTTVAKVKSDFGKGRVLGAEAALAAGMIDRIQTYDQTVQKMLGRKPAAASPSALKIERERLLLS